MLMPEQQKIPAPTLMAAEQEHRSGQFNLLRWFSLASFFFIAAVALPRHASRDCDPPRV